MTETNVRVPQKAADTIPIEAAPFRRRLHWIDSLRGLAVCAVFLHHLLPHPHTGKQPTYLDLGIFGVTVFFCVSGYVIPYSVLKVKQNPAYQFFIARIFRLYPSYWVSLILGAAVLGTGTWQLLANASMLQRFLGVNDVVGAYWTLQVEIIFYAVIELLLVANRVRSKSFYPALALAFGCLAIAGAAVRYYVGKKAPIAPLIGLTVMFTATTYYMHQSCAFLSKAKLRLFVTTIAAILSVIFLLAYSRDWGYQETPHRFLAMYPLACAIFLIFERLEINTPLFQFMGKISYPVYLIHVPVIAIVAQILGEQSNMAIRSAAAVGTTIVGAVVISKFIEEPGIRLGRRLLSKARGAA